MVIATDSKVIINCKFHATELSIMVGRRIYSTLAVPVALCRAHIM